MNKTNKEILKAAQADILANLNKHRITLIDSFIEADEIGAKDNYDDGILAILENHPDGIDLSRLREVFTDGVKLKKARGDLKIAGKIEEKEDKTKVKVFLKQPLPEPQVTPTAAPTPPPQATPAAEPAVA